MLESKPPRNSQPETHPDDERGGVAGNIHASIGWIDFPMPQKTHRESCRVAASLLFCAKLRSNSAGGI